LKHFLKLCKSLKRIHFKNCHLEGELKVQGQNMEEVILENCGKWRSVIPKPLRISLWCSHVNLSGSSFDFLECPNVEFLNLNGCLCIHKVHMKRFPKIRSIILINTNITRNMLITLLESSPFLNKLKVSSIEISNATISSIGKKYPTVEITS